MPLVPLDFPQRCAAAGLPVKVLDGWESRGSSADHRAVVYHWTASSSSESPSSCANYCFTQAEYAPDYNVLVDRDGVVWIGAREKANSSGEISGVALNEALAGATDWRSAASRGLSDTTSANAQLFAISAQNNGTGEPWSDALVHGMATCAAVALECLGLPHAGYVTHHAALTRRKIDLTTGTGGCPDGGTWNQLITDAMHGRGPAPEVEEMWILEAAAEAEETVLVALPFGYKSARVDLWLDCDHDDGAALWAAQGYEGGAEAIGLWASGYTWELWLPGRQRTNTSAELGAGMASVVVQNKGPRGPVYVTVSGT